MFSDLGEPVLKTDLELRITTPRWLPSVITVKQHLRGDTLSHGFWVELGIGGDD